MAGKCIAFGKRNFLLKYVGYKLFIFLTTMPTRLKIGIIFSILLVLGIAGFAGYKNWNSKTSFVKEINTKLSAQDRKIFEDRLADAQNKLKEAQTNDDKFGWEMQIGYNLQALGTLSEAQAAFEKAIEYNPASPIGYAALFQVQADRGDYDSAKKSIITAISKNPTSPDLWKRRIYFEIEKLHTSNDQISALYSEAVNQTNSNTDILTAYATWLESVGNLQAAKEYWQKAIVANPAGKKIYQGEIARLDKLMQTK